MAVVDVTAVKAHFLAAQFAMAVVQGCAVGQGQAGKFCRLMVGEGVAGSHRQHVVDFKNATVVEL